MPNSVVDIRNYFGVSVKEMLAVWEQMSDTEKDEWRNAELK